MSGGLVLAVLAIRVAFDRFGADDNRTDFAARQETNSAERDCIEETIQEIDSKFDEVQAASQSDQSGAILNRDGDRSWVEYATYLGSLNTADCPPEFDAALVEFASTWQAYGLAHLHATEGLIKDSLTEQDLALFADSLNSARDKLQTVASSWGATVNGFRYSFS